MKKVSELIEPGTVLAGKYRVERVLGLGGMGMVVAAHHLQLDERVAIKLQLPSIVQNTQAMARFAREARAAVRIKSEYVARVSDVGYLESGAPFMVMEYLEGEDLADMLTRGKLPAEQAVEFVLQACEALAEAHALGIIHRDIKPANLYCVRRTDGLLAIKLLDFGISRATSSSDLALTSSGVMMGTPHHMAPEQMIAAKNADGRSDIWSLRAVLFELLVGQPPFNAETFAELVIQVTTADPNKLAERLRGLPTGLAQVVLRCLHLEAVLRYPSVSELAQALVPFGPAVRGQVHADRILRIAHNSQHPSFAPPEVGRGEGLEWADAKGKSLMPFGRTSSEGRDPRSRRKRLALVVAVGVVLIMSATGGSWLAAGRSKETLHESTPHAVVRASSPQVPATFEDVRGVALEELPFEPHPRESEASDDEQAETAPSKKPQSQRAQDGPLPQHRAAGAKKNKVLVPAPASTAIEPEAAAPAPEPVTTTQPHQPNFGGRL
ncbi:MAG TPA: serine/threonine-protein kinase [Polyangiaceae bacterium]|nr:serine/threonine-protein kinase [Polyangiaceae bacterium]